MHEAAYTHAVWIGASGFLKTIFFGSAMGVAAAWLIQYLLKRHLVSDHLQSAFALMMVAGVFAVSNLVAHEAGLVTVTVMGLTLANQQSVSIRRIVEFKENLSVLLTAILFILLAARLDLSYFRQLGWRGPVFAAVVIFIARPLSVLAATVGTTLSMPERLFLTWLAPRGIVAAAVASVFALELGDGNDFVAATFLVIMATVITYSSTSGLVARRLGLSEPNPQGLLIAGAHRFGRDIAARLQELSVRVCLVDRNPQNIRRARMAGLTTYYADILSESIHEDLDLGGIGRFLSLLPNDEVNSLAVEHCAELFGRDHVYRLPISTERSARVSLASSVIFGRELFDQKATFDEIRRKQESGALVKATTLTSEYTWADFCERNGHDVLALFQVEGKQVRIITAAAEAVPGAGQTVIALVPGAADHGESAGTRRRSSVVVP